MYMLAMGATYAMQEFAAVNQLCESGFGGVIFFSMVGNWT